MKKLVLFISIGMMAVNSHLVSVSAQDVETVMIDQFSDGYEENISSEVFEEDNGDETGKVFSDGIETEWEETSGNIGGEELTVNSGDIGARFISYDAMMEKQEELELNTYYKIDDFGKWPSDTSRDIQYLFKTNIPQNGRIRIEIEDCRSNVFRSGPSLEPGIWVSNWWKTGEESYDSGWITVKKGMLSGHLRSEEYSNKVNKEARIIFKYERSEEYFGECEDNDTFDTATQISLNKEYDGNYSKYDDFDIYKFEMESPGLAQIVFQNDRNSKIDVVLYEEDEHGNVDAIDSFRNSTRVRLDSGNYFLSVHNIWQYTLCVNANYEDANTYEQEPNNVKSQANDKVTNVWYTGNLNTEEDVDYFKFNLNKNSYLALELKVPRQIASDLIKISLYDKELKLLDSASNTSNPYLKTEEKLYNTGTYYVKVEKGRTSSEFNDDYSFCLNQKEYVNILPAVTGMAAKVTGMNKVVLKWNKVSGAEGYFIIGMNKNRKGGQIAFTSGTSWTDTAADTDAFNFYWVQPYNRDDSGKIVKGKLGNYVYALGRNVGDTGKVTAIDSSDGVKLSWKKVEGANSYVILSKTGSNKAAFNAPMYTNKTTFVDKTAVSGKVTYYWVYGVYKNANGTVLAAGKLSPFAWAKPIAIEGIYVNGTVTLTVYKVGNHYYVDAYGRGGKMNTTVKLYKNGNGYMAKYDDGNTFFTISNISDSGIKVKFPLISEFTGFYSRE